MSFTVTFPQPLTLTSNTSSALALQEQKPEEVLTRIEAEIGRLKSLITKAEEDLKQQEIETKIIIASSYKSREENTRFLMELKENPSNSHFIPGPHREVINKALKPKTLALEEAAQKNLDLRTNLAKFELVPSDRLEMLIKQWQNNFKSGTNSSAGLDYAITQRELLKTHLALLMTKITLQETKEEAPPALLGERSRAAVSTLPSSTASSASLLSSSSLASPENDTAEMVALKKLITAPDELMKQLIEKQKLCNQLEKKFKELQIELEKAKTHHITAIERIQLEDRMVQIQNNIIILQEPLFECFYFLLKEGSLLGEEERLKKITEENLALQEQLKKAELEERQSPSSKVPASEKLEKLSKRLEELAQKTALMLNNVPPVQETYETPLEGENEEARGRCCVM